MAALTKDRDTQRRDGNLLSLPVKANAVLYAGGIALIDNNGLLTAYAPGIGVRAVGRINKQTIGSAIDGEVFCEVERGIFKLDNDPGGGEMYLVDHGYNCFIVDDHTVSRNNPGGARSIAGRLIDLDATGVWVEIGTNGTPYP